jgi:hypothetical protein
MEDGGGKRQKKVCHLALILLGHKAKVFGFLQLRTASCQHGRQSLTTVFAVLLSPCRLAALSPVGVDVRNS